MSPMLGRLMSSPQRRSPCLSNLKLDRLLAEELPASEQAAVRDHIHSCEACSQRLLALQTSRDALRQALPTWSAIAAARPPGLGRRLKRFARRAWPVGAPTVLAFAVLVLWLRQSPVSDPSSSATRTKGGASLGFYVKGDDGVVAGLDGQELRGGEAVRFYYQSNVDMHLVILSRDGAQQISVYHSAGDRSAFAPQGQWDLDGSVILDEVVGPEQIYGFFCPDTFSVDDAIEALEVAPGSPQIEVCSVAELHWQKVAR